MEPVIKDEMATRIDAVLWDSHLKKAESASRLKNFPEAVSMCELAMEKCYAFGLDDWRTISTQRSLARFLTQLKQYERAQRILSGLLSTVGAKFGTNSLEQLELERVLASVLEHKKAYGSAAKLMLHVVNNHPQRLANPSDADYKAARRKYDLLKAKSQQDAWGQLAC